MMIQEDISGLDDEALQMALVEWKRWRSRICHAETMNRRQERFAQAGTYIEAIEEEITFRQRRADLHRHARERAALIASTEIVPLADYRSAHNDLKHLEQRIARSRPAGAKPFA